MRKHTLLLSFCFFISITQSFASNIIDPIHPIQMDEYEWTTDNPKGKIKIRFIRNEDKSDTTNKPKGFFGKLKSVVNMLMDAADNPPFKVEITREKEKKN